MSTSAGLKKDLLLLARLARPSVGDVGGELVLEKLEVEVADPVDARLSMELHESRKRVRGAACVSEEARAGENH